MTTDSQTESRPFSLCYSLYFLLFHYALPQSLFAYPFQRLHLPVYKREALVAFSYLSPLVIRAYLVTNRFSDLLPAFIYWRVDIVCLETLDALCANLERI